MELVFLLGIFVFRLGGNARTLGLVRDDVTEVLFGFGGEMGDLGLEVFEGPGVAVGGVGRAEETDEEVFGEEGGADTLQ